MSFFIQEAFAAAPGPQGDGAFSLVMIVAVFVLFYLMLIRPQNKRAKEHRDLLGRLKKGDEIITASGMLAKIVSLDEQYVKVAIASGVEIYVQKGAINSVLPKGTIKSI